ncbi:EKI2 kinase, partial [Asarcornis scutulata]|uniref:ethanolamine kinase n=3 Tax=Anatinae TaxID=2068716 RepID=U3IYW2_ANAPP|nr:EKI2 kinase [Asarcornis scutulata]|eukprot:XP_027300980.1 ethanolamine kinase 2 isoform X1 [Anas platyrhynchos]
MASQRRAAPPRGRRPRRSPRHMGRGSGCSELGMAGAAGRCPDCSEADRARGRGRGVPPCVPHLGIAVDEGDVLPGALRLVRELRPGWEPARVKTKLFTDGITNKLVACYTDEDMVDAVLVRIYGRKTELFVDRETELRNFQVLRAHGCAPDLYCAFQNGLCYEFLPGIALGPDHVRDPRIFRLVAQEMARVHAIHANGSLPKPILWQKLHKYLTLVKMDLSPKVPNPSLHQDVPSLETLEHELAWMKETLSQLGSPVVLCHNDLLCKNIIYNRTQEQVRFIDYEYTGYNYQAFDIGNHFNEFAGVKEVDYRLYPSKDTQLQWLRSYLQAYKQLTQGEQGGAGPAVSDKELEALYVQVNKFSLASHFLWACWGLIQDKYSTIDFNFLRYAKLRFKQYFKMKPVVTALQLSK